MIEEPRLGLELLQDRDARSSWTLEAGMVLSNSSHVVELNERAIAYMADTSIVGERGGEVLSQKPVDVYIVG